LGGGGVRWRRLRCRRGGGGGGGGGPPPPRRSLTDTFYVQDKGYMVYDAV
jgi:hypothetical protein